MTNSRSPLIPVLLLWAAGLGAAAQFAKFAVPFLALQAAYPAAAGTYLGFMVSLISLLGIALGLVAGQLVAHLGLRRILLVALVLGAGISAVQSLMLPMAVMLSLRVIEGLSHLAIVVAAPTLIAEIAAPKWRAGAMTLWSTYFAAGFALMAWFGMPLVTHYGLHGLLLGHAAFLLGLAAVLWALLPPVRQSHHKPLKTSLWALHMQTYCDRRIATPALARLFYTLTFVAVLTVLPAELPPASRVLTATLMPLAGLAASLTLGAVLLQWVPAMRVVILGFATGLAIAVWLAFVPDAAHLAVVMFACLGLVQAGSFAAVPQLNSEIEARAMANGAIAQSGNLGNMLGAPVMLLILPYGGLAGMFAFTALCYAAGIVVSLRAPRQVA